MKRFTFAALAVLATTTIATAQDIGADRVASAILHGFVQQDVQAIAPFSNETNADFFNAIANGVESEAELFEGTRGAAGLGWDGMILPVRYNARGQAIVPFAIEGANGPAALGSGVDGRYMAIVLTLDSPEDTSWGFEDINYIGRSDYAAMAQTR
ncbi:hypothetical protein K3728_09935 [Rhodobacteraceae bacterium M385]|nr:hypothetical protein K3728_09935 [Rhodobacteraceae bacterium M385]